MARGWESKSVESQMEDRRTEQVSRGERRDPAEIERQRERERLEMSRVRVTRELGTATSSVHRAALENALRFLDEQLGRLR